MTEKIAAHVVKEILGEMIQSAERVEIHRETERTERSRIEAQKEVILEYLKGNHLQNMLTIQASSQERIEMIRQIGQILSKEHVNESDKFFCEQMMKVIADGQQAAAASLGAPQQLLLK